MGDDDGSKKSLDLTSSQYNPYKALYARKVPLPSPNAPILDNITKFVETEEGILVKPHTKAKVGKKTKDEPSTSTSTPRFQPHQEPIPGKAKRAAKNVLTRMSTAEGPLALLQRCMDTRIKIKVVTRNMCGVRGYCNGYLVAFDKHLNMALEDVTEVWTRKKHLKTPPLGKGDDVEVPQPRVRVRDSTATTEECERYVSKLLMRGEHVVLISAKDS